MGEIAALRQEVEQLRAMTVPCHRCGGHGGTCILLHDGSPHGREHCQGAQWQECEPCVGTGRVNVMAVLMDVVELRELKRRLREYLDLYGDDRGDRIDCRMLEHRKRVTMRRTLREFLPELR